MSFEEPKAPIVRIRKKKTKKKSKENDVVHLPVRVSRQTRYSSLVPPPNPQNKGRECCRHVLATCFKIPVCKLVCFRCILPKCYSGNGSDDEENQAEYRDEGYHSQNRRSSEVTPVPVPLAAQPSTSDHPDVEMTEMKVTETVVLIPPPRSSNNEYRKDPCSSDQDQLEGATGDITYIEVESVSLHRDGSPPTDDSDNIVIPKFEPKSENKQPVVKSSSLKVSDKDLTPTKQVFTDYEIPIHLRFDTEKSKSSVVRPKTELGPVLANVSKETVNLVECDNNDSSKEHYVNDEIIKASQNLPVSHVKQDTSDPESIDYANIQGVDAENKVIVHSKTTNVDLGDNNTDITEDEQHDYMNLTSLDTNPEPRTKDKNKKEVKVYGMINTKSEDIIKLRKDLFSKYSSKKKEVKQTKSSDKESILAETVSDQNIDKVEPVDKLNGAPDASNETSELKIDAIATDKVLLPVRTSVKHKSNNNESSSSEDEAEDSLQELVNEETTDQTKLI